MFFTRLNHRAYHALVLLLLVLGLALVVIPDVRIDAFIILISLLLIGHVFLQERLLLAFLVVRPAIDLYRERVLFFYDEHVINVNAAISLLFVLWGSYMVYRHYKHVVKTPLLPGFAFLGILFLLSFFYSVTPFITFIEVIKFINVILFFVLGYAFMRSRSITIKQLLIVTGLAAMLPVLLGVVQAVLKTGITTFDVHGRIFGTFAHPNVFAFFLMTLIFLLIQFGYTDVKKEIHKRLRSVPWTLTLLSILLILTFTRAAWIGMLVFLLVIGVMHYRRMLAVLISLLVVSYVILFPFNRWLFQNYDIALSRIQVVERLTSRNDDADSFAWRISVFNGSLPIIAARPYFGYGYGSFVSVWSENRGAQHLWDDSAEAHNDYLRILLETGIVGLFVYLVLLALLLARSLYPLIISVKKRVVYIPLFAWIFSFIVMSVSDNMLHHTPVMWLTFLWWGALFAHYKRYDEAPNLIVS